MVRLSPLAIMSMQTAQSDLLADLHRPQELASAWNLPETNCQRMKHTDEFTTETGMVFEVSSSTLSGL